jgi:carbon monoxide dehydrogenase subunit G
MKVSIAIERSIEVPAPVARVQTLFKDLEGTIGRFPKLRKLSKLGDNEYLWEMGAIGSSIANIAHEVSYAAKYNVDLKNNQLSWQPVPRKGNASIEGAFKLAERGESTQLTFKVRGDLFDVPVPLMYRLLAPAFIQGKFTRLVDIFLERTSEALQQEPAPKRKSK